MKQFLSAFFAVFFVVDGFCAPAQKVRIPAAPSGLYVTSDTQVVAAWVYWTDNSNNETSFFIQRSALSSGPWVTIGITNVPAWVSQGKGTRAFKDLSVQTGFTYFYRVYASNSKGNSSPSNVGSVTIGSSVQNPAPTATTNAISNGVSTTGSVSGSTVQTAWAYYYLDVPSNVSSVTATVTGLSGDVDLYTRYGGFPTTNSFTCKSANYGTTAEKCEIFTTSSGRWYFGVVNASIGTFTFTITVTYTLTTSTNCTFSLSNGSTNVTDAGGTVGVTITTPCRWGMGTLPSWITSSTPQTYLAGNGTTTVSFTVAASTDSAQRYALVYFYDPFAGTGWSSYFRITQDGSGCAIELWPASRFVSAAGGLGQLGVQTAIAVTYSQTNADAFTLAGGGICPVVAVSDSAWLVLNSATNGFTPIEISYAVEPNPTNGVRSAYIDVDGEIFAIHQSPNETNAPSTPVGLSSFALSSTAIYLSWTASTDDDRIGLYRVYKDGTLYDSTPVNSITVVDLPETTQSSCYQVVAVDINGNSSVASTNRCVAPLPSSQRLVPITMPGAPASFAGYRPAVDLKGKVNIAFLRARFQDQVTNSLMREYYESVWVDPAQDSAAQVWQDESYGQVRLKGDIFDYVTLPINSTSNGQVIISALYDYLLTIGVDLTRYDGYVLDVPLNTLTSIDPAITLDGRKFWTIPMWGSFPAEHPRISRNGLDIRNNDEAATRYAHNFGHYMNLSEGIGILLNNQTFTTNRSTQQAIYYATPFDPMGNLPATGVPSRERQFSSWEKERLGWLRRTKVTTSGSYTVNPYANPASAVKALQIPTGDGEGFWNVEYRRPQLAVFYQNIHYALNSCALDFSPTNSTNFLYQLDSMSQAGLAVSQSFTDLWNGTIISLVSTNSTAAVVSVTLGTLDSSAPTLSITSPATGTSFQGAIPIYWTAVDNKQLTLFEVYEDGILQNRYYNPTCATVLYESPFVACETNVSTWGLYKPSSIGIHAVSVVAWDTVNATTNTITLTATIDTTPTREVFSTPLNGQTVDTNQLVTVGYVTTPDLDVKLMRIYVDNEMVAFTHVGFIPYGAGLDVLHSLGSRTWYILNSKFTFDTAFAIASGNVDLFGNPKPPPHRLYWDTRSELNGEHTLTLEVEDFSGNILRRTITVTVINPG